MMHSTGPLWSFAQMGPPPTPPGKAAAHKRRLDPAMDDEEDMAEEEMVEKEWQYHHEGGKKRRLTSEQVKFLEGSFEAESRLDPERKILIARHIQLQPRQVAVWFQNRRARWRAKQMEHDFEALEASYDAVVKENEKLQAEVSALNALLHGSDAHAPSLVQDATSSVLPAITTCPSRHQHGNSSKSEADSPTKSDQSEVADSSCDASASEPSILRTMEGSNSSFYSDGLLESIYNPVILQQVAVKAEENLTREENGERLFSWEEPGLFYWYD